MAKARIKTTMQKDYFGTGNEKEITFDDGRVYRIKSSAQKDYFGDGQELEMYEVTDTNKNKPKYVYTTTKDATIWIFLSKLFALLAILSLAIPPIFIIAGWHDFPILGWLICIIVLPCIFMALADGVWDYMIKHKGLDKHEVKDDEQ